MKILYKYPSRQRPHKLFPSLDRFYSLVRHLDFQLVITLDEDDASMQTATSQESWYAYANRKSAPIVDLGFSKGKVDAINRGMEKYTDWDILVLLSDDMELLPGFDTEILKAFEDGFSGLAHFPDGHANGRLCTFPVMDRKYYDLFGYIYNPIYKSVYCDNEQHQVAVLMKRYKYIPVNIVRHMHPIWGHATFDELYFRNENRLLYHQDGEVFKARKVNNFGL